MWPTGHSRQGALVHRLLPQGRKTCVQFLCQKRPGVGRREGKRRARGTGVDRPEHLLAAGEEPEAKAPAWCLLETRPDAALRAAPVFPLALGLPCSATGEQGSRDREAGEAGRHCSRTSSDKVASSEANDLGWHRLGTSSDGRPTARRGALSQQNVSSSGRITRIQPRSTARGGCAGAPTPNPRGFLHLTCPQNTAPSSLPEQGTDDSSIWMLTFAT